MRSRSSLWARKAAVAAVCFGLVLSAGCGKVSNPQVQGRVTAGGKPVVWGTVNLVDEKGVYYQGIIDLNGHYVIDNVPPGTVKIGVVSSDPGPASAAGGKGGGGGGAPVAAGRGRGGNKADDAREARGFRQDTSGEPPKPPPGAWFPIHAKYADPNTSELTGEVKPGKVSELNIELK